MPFHRNVILVNDEQLGGSAVPIRRSGNKFAVLSPVMVGLFVFKIDSICIFIRALTWHHICIQPRNNLQISKTSSAYMACRLTLTLTHTNEVAVNYNNLLSVLVSANQGCPRSFQNGFNNINILCSISETKNKTLINIHSCPIMFFFKRIDSDASIIVRGFLSHYQKQYVRIHSDQYR